MRALDEFHHRERIFEFSLAVKSPGSRIKVCFRRFATLFHQQGLVHHGNSLVQFFGAAVQVNQRVAVVIQDFGAVNRSFFKAKHVLEYGKRLVVAFHTFQVHGAQHAGLQVRRIPRGKILVEFIGALTQSHRFLDPCRISDILLPDFLGFGAQKAGVHVTELAPVAFDVHLHAHHRGRVSDSFHRGPLVPHGNHRVKHLVSLAVHSGGTVSQRKRGLVATHGGRIRLFGIAHGVFRLLLLKGNGRKRVVGTRHINALFRNILCGILQMHLGAIIVSVHVFVLAQEIRKERSTHHVHRILFLEQGISGIALVAFGKRAHQEHDHRLVIFGRFRQRIYNRLRFFHALLEHKPLHHLQKHFLVAGRLVALFKEFHDGGVLAQVKQKL